MHSSAIFETDCKLLVESIYSKQNGSSEFHMLVDKCKLLLNLISNSMVSFVRRQANIVGHNLAKAFKFNAHI